MDYPKWTPNKSKMNCESFVILSPITKTPIRQKDIKLKSSFHSNTNSYSVLPSHITPPSGLTKFIARNPFEADLTNKLHVSVISPSVFSKVVSPTQKGSPNFTWSIDELALIQPAKIDEFPIQQMHCSDPEIEKNAQEAISRFFSENQIIPSPYDIKRNEFEKATEMKTPLRAHENENLLKESHKSKNTKKDCWTQTVLSLPPILPVNVEEILKPYFNFTQDQNCENDDANSSNTSLRRKLFSNHDDSHDDSHDESNSSILISPVKSKTPLIQHLSPPQSGMFFHGTPLRNRSQIIQRAYGSPLAYSRNSSPCDVSPIRTPSYNLNMSCQSIKSRNKSVARLDFTKDMSIEVTSEEERGSKKDSIAENICKTLFYEEIEIVEKNKQVVKERKNYNVSQMILSTENSLRFKSEDKENFTSNNFSNIDKSKCIDACKTNFSESYAMQESNMLSGNYIQQMAFINSAQDTGYHTNSSNNITSNMDSYSTSIKLKLHWDERIGQTDDEVQLADWKENIKNVISSTPSKFNKCVNNL